MCLLINEHAVIINIRANDGLDASYHRKRKFDPSLQGRKPDFAVFTSNQYKKAHLLVVEVKSAKHHATKSKELYDDLVKLGNEMKDVIDKIIDDGVDKDVVVCGLLVEGKYLVIVSLLGQHLSAHSVVHDLCNLIRVSV